MQADDIGAAISLEQVKERRVDADGILGGNYCHRVVDNKACYYAAHFSTVIIGVCNDGTGVMLKHGIVGLTAQKQ